MPELPEVETVRIGLEKLLTGRRIGGLEIRNPGSFALAGFPPDCRWQDILPGRTVRTVERRAKLLMIHLDADLSLAIHLKMTGQLVFVPLGGGERFGAGHPSDSLVDGLPDRSTRLIFTLDNGILYFNDQRKFGWVHLMPTAEITKLPFYRGLGPEPLAEGFGAADLAQRLRRKPGSLVKAALLDQTVVAGIGNIYADEALWQAAVHPETRVRELRDDEIEGLWAGVRQVMNLSISLGGSTDRNYVDAEGKRGAYLGFAAVFRRQGQPCKRCGTTIIKTRVAGRGTHLCPVCQVRRG